MEDVRAMIVQEICTMLALTRIAFIFILQCISLRLKARDPLDSILNLESSTFLNSNEFTKLKRPQTVSIKINSNFLFLSLTLSYFRNID